MERIWQNCHMARTMRLFAQVSAWHHWGAWLLRTMAAKMAWRKVLDSWYLDEADSGTHSAAGWALRHVGYPLKEIPEEDGRRKRFAWQLTKTRADYDPHSRGCKSNRWQDSFRRRIRIARDFLLSDREVSVCHFSDNLWKTRNTRDSNLRPGNLTTFPAGSGTIILRRTPAGTVR